MRRIFEVFGAVPEILVEAHPHIGNAAICDVRKIPAKYVILATGHSARDIFKLLVRREIAVETKPLAIWVWIEHPQAVIDFIQLSCGSRGKYLPEASYSVVHQVEGSILFACDREGW